jgi:hypothetical protein
MSNRREFTKAVKVEIIKRAIPQGTRAPPWCEKCDAMAYRFEIDHRDPDAMQIDKSKPLTAAEGWLLCIPCHSEKTAKDVADIAKAKRREASHLGAKRDKQPIKSDPHALRSRSRPAHEGREPMPARPMFVSLGEAASAVLAKITPIKDAAE